MTFRSSASSSSIHFVNDDRGGGGMEHRDSTAIHSSIARPFGTQRLAGSRHTNSFIPGT